MKNFKKILTLALSLLLVFSVAACGNKKDSTDNGGQGGKTTIYVGDRVTSKEGFGAFNLQMQAEFAAAHPEINVVHKDPLSSDPKKNVQNVINNLNNSELAYTILTCNNNTYARTVYQTGMTANWLDYLTEDQLAEYDQNVLAGFYSKGGLVALPQSVSYPMLGFNKKHLRSSYVKKQVLGENYANNYTEAEANKAVEAEVDKIETWADFKAFAEKLTGKYIVNSVETNVSGYGGWFTDYYIGQGYWNLSNGYTTAVQNDDNTITFNLNNTSMVETLEFLQGMKNDGIIKQNAYLEYSDFFQKIFRYEIASFIFYPEWSTGWFEPNGIYASDIKIIPIPYGPSIEKLKEQNAEVPATNPMVSVCFVLNGDENISEEAKRAAATYMTFMNSKEAWERRLAYAAEEGIPTIEFPPYEIDPDLLDSTIYATMPLDWKTAISKSSSNATLFDIDSDSFISYINAALPGIINGEDSSGKYDTREKIQGRLTSLTNLVYDEWLTAYNNKVRK